MDQDSLLLSLPNELRLCIWELVLISDETIIFSANCDRTQPALLQTCRLVRSEAKTIYYAQNRFHFTICGWDHIKMLSFTTMQLKVCKDLLPAWEYDERADDFRLIARPTWSVCECPENAHNRKVNTRNLKTWLWGAHKLVSVNAN